MVFMCPLVVCEVKKIVPRMPEILFAAEMAFRRLHRCMSQQELNLLQLFTARMARVRASSCVIVLQPKNFFTSGMTSGQAGNRPSFRASGPIGGKGNYC
jgi:hypothetical protein